MDKAKQIYLDFKREAIFLDLDFPLFLGNGPGCGELCMDYSEQDGYMLYGYERGERNSEFKTTDFEEFKYEVFLHICWYMGMEFELPHRKEDIKRDDNILETDTRKIAFEKTLQLLKTVNPAWIDKAAQGYTAYLNLWRKNQNVYFDKTTMEFKVNL
ncbi:TPA: immunity 63 family protein [Listeria innocua]|nr:immunity 63 family protein [Listeria innocua]